MSRAAFQLLKRKREGLRVCALLTLGIVLTGLAVGGPVSPGPATPAESGAAEGRASVAPLRGFTVAVDPGHGGYDGGARARDSGRWEKDVTLEIALAVEQALAERGAAVTLTRREDVCLAVGDTATRLRKRRDLQERINIALDAGADVLLSIHLNDYRSRAESGPQVFYQYGGDAGRLLAGALQETLVARLRPQKERKAMAGNYYVLRSRLPSALVECGFLSNAEEEKKLLDAAYQREIAQAVAEGVSLYKKLTEELEKTGR